MTKNLKSGEKYAGNLIWIDLEMSGLIPEKDVILEIATIITNNSLDIIATGPNLIIHQPDHVLGKMDDWCVKTHTASGLVNAVRESKITIAQAAQETLAFISNYCQKGVSPICGDSFWQDRVFLRKYMPSVEEYFHYRNIDVSTIKEVVNRWYPTSSKLKYTKPENHRALEDIIHSIEELRHYKTYYFLPEM